jgi:hypothetical protein
LLPPASLSDFFCRIVAGPSVAPARWRPGTSSLWRALCLGAGLLPGSLCAEPQAVSLGNYLEQGRAAGYNIIYGSSLLRDTERIEVEEGDGFSLERLRRELAARGLALEPLGPSTWQLRRAEKATPAPAPISIRTPRIEEVVVHSSRYEWSREVASATVLGGEELIRRPVIANDALRVVNQLPGSASVGLSARPRVRGGRENETLIEFDSVRLYNPFHFSSYNSLYSVFDERLLGELEFFSGAYPLRYGDSLSAALSIRPPDAESLNDRRELGLGLTQLSYFHSAVSDSDTLLLNLRRSGPESGELLEAQELGHPEFADAYLRYERDTDSGRRWSLNALWYGDDLELGEAGGAEIADSQYSSSYLWGRLRSADSSSLDWQLTLGGGYLDNRRSGIVSQPGKVSGALDERLQMLTVFASQDFSHISAARQLSAGWDYRYLDSDYRHRSEQQLDPAFAQLSNVSRPQRAFLEGDQRAHQGALYVSGKQRLREGLYFDAALRLDAHRFEDREDLQPTYRLGLLYQASENLDLRVAWGRYAQAQALNELPIADLAPEVPEAQTGTQWVTGMEWRAPVLGATLRLEAYRKDVDEVSAYYGNLANAFTLIPELQPDRIRVAPDRYRAQGVELSLSIPFSWGEVWGNYAYSSARDRIDGEFVSRAWDQGRTLNVGAIGKLGAWDLAVVGSFHEGWLNTPLGLLGGVVRAGARNSQRFDRFLTLDFKLLRRWEWGRQALRLELGLNNLTDRENVIGTDYAPSADEGLTATPFESVGLNVAADLYWSF